jgi:putative spermidine/putrescine transport system ATP-binding protein
MEMLSCDRHLEDAHIAVRSVTKTYGPLTVLSGVDLHVGRGEFVSLLGPSGCGKTTLLRAIAGLVSIDDGAISVDGRNLQGLPPHRRNIGMVFQSYALFPHLTVAENVAFGLKARGDKAADIEPVVRRMLELVHMEAYSGRRTQALSGGQQQRVAVARALATRPDLMLFDEPFSALDRKLRETMEIELRRLLRELDITSIFVTHDQEEALVMSDRIAVMNRGVIEQFATPVEVYSRPATEFTLQFVGMSTRIHGRLESVSAKQAVVDTSVGKLLAPAGAGLSEGMQVVVGIRPDKLSYAAEPAANSNRVRVPLVDQVYLGSKLLLNFRAYGDDVILGEAPAALNSTFNAGDEIDIHWPIEDTLVFPDDRSKPGSYRTAGGSA